nr:chromatin regulatory protein sir2 [Hymenolepis microstoma]
MDEIKMALDSSEKSNSPLESLDLEGIAKYILIGKAKNIITAVGAGISTAAGIPDFRSPKTGLYSNLDEYGLDDPMDVFDLNFFEDNPEPFFKVAKSLYHPNAKPTLAHYFIKLLNEKGLLLRDYTQNIDMLERISGIPEEKLIEAHGSYNTGRCLKCKKKYPFEYFKKSILEQKIPTCSKENCGEVIKPDIVFFGEDLPKRYHSGVLKDFKKCDLLIIMGTSLKVTPFNHIIDFPNSTVPRLLINRELSENSHALRPLKWGKEDNLRDVFFQGDTDDGCLRLAELLGWKSDLLLLQEARNKELDEKFAEESRQSE